MERKVQKSISKKGFEDLSSKQQKKLDSMEEKIKELRNSLSDKVSQIK